MKGIIFNLLEEMVEDEGGPAAWDGLLESAGVEGGYSSLGDYPDEELSNLIEARSRRSAGSELAVMRSFGEFALLSLADRYPAFFTPHSHTRAFLLTLNDVIHPDVRKLHPDARPPEFEFDSTGADQLTIVYRSERRLCGFAEGMIAGAASHFGERVEIVQQTCVHAGADRCVLDCTFLGRPGERATAG